MAIVIFSTGLAKIMGLLHFLFERQKVMGIASIGVLKISWNWQNIGLIIDGYCYFFNRTCKDYGVVALSVWETNLFLT